MIEHFKDNSFDPVHIFECGQCFRWTADEKGVYTGVAGGKVCRVENGKIICSDEDNEFFSRYFSLDTDYSRIKTRLAADDETLKTCTEYGNGIRILMQDVWETTVSFIISSNNNIPRIRSIIEKMCILFGEPIETKYGTYYSFPAPEKLSVLSCEDLAPLRAGYRDKFILDAAQKVSAGEVDLQALASMDTPAAKKELMRIKGVGGKVADCILLFSLGRFEVFPKDVWIKRILDNVYGIGERDIDEFAFEKFGKYAGFAQQYLYYYFRDKEK